MAIQRLGKKHLLGLQGWTWFRIQGPSFRLRYPSRHYPPAKLYPLFPTFMSQSTGGHAQSTLWSCQGQFCRWRYSAHLYEVLPVDPAWRSQSRTFVIRSQTTKSRCCGGARLATSHLNIVALIGTLRRHHEEVMPESVEECGHSRATTDMQGTC